MDSSIIVCNLNSEYRESFKRELYLSFEEKDSSAISTLLHTNEKTSIEIIELVFNGNGKYNSVSRMWSPKESVVHKDEFDYNKISYCLYSNDNVYLGYANGSVRQYSMLNTNNTGKLLLEDNYYNEMFGDSQESDNTDEKKGHWLNSDNDHKISSRLLMKHMGYPICIKENNNKIYVLYDDGILMSTDKEYSKGYNVKRYHETFHGSLYFSLNSKGNCLALSTNDRRLILSSINNDELENKNNSKILFETTLFRKTSFENSEKTKNPYNILNTCWSLCDKYLFIPGETEIRVLDVDDYKNSAGIKVFEEDEVEKSEICLVKVTEIESKVNCNLNLLLSLDIAGGLNIYTYEDGLINIKKLNKSKLFMFDKIKKNSYPISLDLIKRENEHFFIGVVLNTGEVTIRKLNIGDKGDINYSKSNVNLVNYPTKGSSIDNKYGKNDKISKLIDDIAQVDGKNDDKYDDNIFMEDDDYVEDEFLRDKGDNDEEEDASEKDSRTGINDYYIYEEDNDSNKDDENEDIDDEYEDEYENWDKKELGKHINYLKKRIEKLKDVINNSNESQSPITPGYTGENVLSGSNDSLMEENMEYLLCWNHSGYMIYKMDDMNEKPIIDLECYNSIDGPKKIRIYDTKGFNMGCVGMDGYLLGRKAKSLENGKYVPSILEYRLWRTWGRNDKTGWTKELLVGEDLICMTCSKDFVAAVTSMRYLRIWKNSGINKLIIKLLGSPVSCVSNEDYLFVITQKEPFYYKTANDYESMRKKYMNEIISGKCNTYEVYIINVNYETIIYNDIMSVSPGTIIVWCGITNKGVPVVKDSSGQTYILSRQWKNQKENWIPCTNFDSLEKNIGNKYFILSLEEDYFNVIKLPEGCDSPIPLMAKNSLSYTGIKIPYNIPILGLPSSIRQWMNIIENDKTLSECVTNNNIPWEIIDELILKLDIKYNTILSSILLLNESDDHEYGVQLKQYKFQKEKLLMRLYMKLLVKQLVEPAFDVVRMFSYPKSFQIALEQAEKSGERILSNKINQEIQMRSRIEQYGIHSLNGDGKNLNDATSGAASANENLNIMENNGKYYNSCVSNTENSNNNVDASITNTNSSLPFNIKSKGETNDSLGKSDNVINSVNETIKFYNNVIKKRKV
ncbi:WD40 repeat protein [Cryptosporidium ryanae]|uniref:WD40 repeat protein n=1 Tax=Cryptosporidium ryanae TaxID=515981 RepID=UPI00351A75DE|nr:WD40 repeat protein [Cryptosporidium ryanae]